MTLRSLLLTTCMLVLAAPGVASPLAGGPGDKPAMPAVAAAAAPAPAAPAPTPPVSHSRRGTLVMENVPATPAAVRERLAAYQNLRTAGFVDWTTDGQMVIATRFGEVAQLHTVAFPGAARHQITFAAEPITTALNRPGHDQILFAKDVGGNELYGLYLLGPDGAPHLVSTPGTRNQDAVWSEDGQHLAWAQVTPGQANWDVVVRAPNSDAAPRVVFSGQGAFVPLAFSPDGTKLLIGKSMSINQGERLVLDLATGATTPIGGQGVEVAYSGGRFTTDGRGVLLLTDENSAFKRLQHIDLSRGQKRFVSMDVPWDVEEFALSPDGRTLAYTVNEHGASKLFLIDLKTGRSLPAPNLAMGVISGLAFDGSGARLGFGFDVADQGADAYSYDLRARTLSRWTHSEMGGLDTAQFVAPKLIEVTSFDGRKIPAFVYSPAKAKGPVPVVIQIHGGPEAQSRPGFNSTIQYWVNELGLAVIVPNVRGSNGYGKDYLKLDNGYKREDSVRDIGAFIDWVGTQPQLDSKRVAVYGGSYGGYMVLASLVHFSDRLAGGVDIVGISNFNTFLKNTEGYRRDLRRVEYGDEREPKMQAFLEAISPLNNVHKIRTPLFVIQGANDPRVPASEATQIVAQARQQGLNVWYMLAEDEGHGFRKKANRDAQREAETLFFEQIFGLK